MSDQMIEIALQTASQKLKEFFPVDNKGDVSIIFKDQKFKLQKAHLRFHGKYFQQKLSNKSSVLEIKGDFEAEIVYNILHLIYGVALQIQRMDAIHYFEVSKCLGIQYLAKVLATDMINNFRHYDIFKLFDISMKYEQQQIFQKCLFELQRKNYKQFKTNRQSLMKTSEEIFRLVIKSYNRFTGKKIFNIYQVMDLINCYSEQKDNEKQYARYLKFQLIDISKLTSQQYNILFLQEQMSFSRNSSNRSRGYSNCSENSVQEEDQYKITQNCNQRIFQNTIGKKSLALQMQKKLEKKITDELYQQKQKMKLQLGQLKQVYSQQMKKSCDTHEQIMQLKRSLSLKIDGRTLISDQLTSIDQKLSLMSQRMEQTTLKLNQLLKQSQSFIESNYRKNQNRKQSSIQEDNIYMSQLQDKHFLIPDMNQLSGEDSSCSLQKKESQFRAKNLFFDVQPVTIKTQQQFQIFLDKVMIHRFKSKKLDLLLRRSKKKGHYGLVSDLINRNKNLIFIFRTQDDKCVAGRVFSNIQAQGQVVSDSQAYIFTMTGNDKFLIKPDCIDQAVSIGKGFIVCFSTDLMISQNCLQEQSYCQWPNSYQAKQNLSVRGSNWLVGSSQFRITQLQCYQIQFIGVQMVL